MSNREKNGIGVDYELPSVGQAIYITGTHPWSGCRGVVVSIDLIGWSVKEPAARVKLDDAPNVPPGQECYVRANHWRFERRAAR